jgi:CRP-like cAMP-binding protein/rubredoxin
MRILKRILQERGHEMTHWMCVQCGYYLQAKMPPSKCPSCNQTCVFNDVTCYRPECGGESNIDPLLVGSTLGWLAKPPTTALEPTLTRSSEKSIPFTEIFSSLSEKQIKAVRDLGQMEYYEPDTVICKEGAESSILYVVEDGQVAVKPELISGILVPLTIVSKNAAFGWSALVPPYILTATVITLTKTRVLAIKRASLFALMQTDPGLGLTVMQNIASIVASRFRRFEEEMIAFAKQRR